MPIPFKDILSSQKVNNTFLDKTINDVALGKIELNNTAPESGSSISNIQRQININTKLVFAQSTKVNGDTISLDSLSMQQEHRLIGDGAPVTLNNLPFTGSQIALDGTRITLVGHSDTSTVTIEWNDSQYGCLLNGDATLERGSMLTLVYNNELERYIEESRNF